MRTSPAISDTYRNPGSQSGMQVASSTFTSYADRLAELGARLSTRLRRWWTACREDRTKSVGRQVAELAWLRTRRGFSVGEYYAYGFASESCDLSEIEDYASNRWHWRCHLPALNDRHWTYSVENKFAFAQHCVARGLRTVRVFGVFHPEHGRTVQDEPLRSARQYERVNAHPDTGADFRGHELPHWQATLDLCRRAARSTPGLASIGWDVVLAPDGPSSWRAIISGTCWGCS